jgi:hypothetical protein
MTNLEESSREDGCFDNNNDDTKMNQARSIGILAGYVLDSPGFDSHQWQHVFLYSIQTGFGDHPILYPLDKK